MVVDPKDLPSFLICIQPILFVNSFVVSANSCTAWDSLFLVLEARP